MVLACRTYIYVPDGIPADEGRTAQERRAPVHHLAGRGQDEPGVRRVHQTLEPPELPEVGEAGARERAMGTLARRGTKCRLTAMVKRPAQPRS